MALPLLAFLVLNRGAPVPRQFLAFTLWPDADEETARANLRRNLYILTQALPAAPRDKPWIAVKAQSLQWNPKAEVTIDVDDFETLSDAENTLDAAVDLYAGDLFESLYFDWVFPERERLHALFVEDLTKLVMLYRRKREFQQAIRHATRLLAIDPWHETTVRALMGIRYESGDGAGAIAEFDEFADRLRAELNVDPMPETRALRDIIRTGGVVDSPLPAESAPSARAQTLLPFVGRKALCDEILQIWQQAAQRRGMTILVSGEAGVGKSRLLDEISTTVAARGARTLRGTTAYPEQKPYQCIIDALRSAYPLVAALNLPATTATTLAQIIPELRRTPAGSSSPAQIDDTGRQQRLFEALAISLKMLSMPRPLFVVLEDLHWAGEGTIAAVEFLAGSITELPILIAVTCREEEITRSHALRRARRSLTADGRLNEISLGPLTREDVTEFIALVPSIAADEHIADEIFERSSGNALFVDEMIRSLAQGEREIPPRIRETIAARIERLSNGARSFVEMAAVSGTGFDVEIVQEVGGWNRASAIDALDELLDRHIVKESGGRQRSVYAFSHQLIHATVYDAIDPVARRLHHRRIATVIEELYTDRIGDFLADLARHWDRGGDAERAALYYVRLAKQDTEIYADDEALASLARALELSATNTTRVEALLLREPILGKRGSRDQQRADLDALSAIAASEQNDALDWQVLRRRCTLAHVIGDPNSESMLEELVRRSKASGTIAWIADAERLSAERFSMLSNFERCQQAATAALRAYDRLGNVTGSIETLCLLAKNSAIHANTEESTAYLADALTRSGSQHDSLRIAHAMMAGAVAANERQDFAAYRDFAMNALALFRSIGDLEGEAESLNGLGLSFTRLGAYSKAREALHDANAISRRIGKRVVTLATTINLGILDFCLGDFDAARDNMVRAQTLAAELKHLVGEGLCFFNLIGIMRNKGHFTEALRFAERAVEIFRRGDQPGYEASALGMLAAVQRDCGEIEKAIEIGERALAQHELAARRIDAIDAAAELALSYLKAGKSGRASALVERYLEDSSQFENATWPQKLHWVAAQAYRATDDARSELHLRTAFDVYQRMAGLIEEPRYRETFTAISLNRAIVAASTRGEWPVAEDALRTPSR